MGSENWKYATAISPASRKPTGRVNRPTRSNAPPKVSRMPANQNSDRNVARAPLGGMPIGNANSFNVPDCMKMNAATMRSRLCKRGAHDDHFAPMFGPFIPRLTPSYDRMAARRSSSFFTWSRRSATVMSGVTRVSATNQSGRLVTIRSRCSDESASITSLRATRPATGPPLTSVLSATSWSSRASVGKMTCSMNPRPASGDDTLPDSTWSTSTRKSMRPPKYVSRRDRPKPRAVYVARDQADKKAQACALRRSTLLLWQSLLKALEFNAIPLDPTAHRSEEHTSELQSQFHLVCRLLLEKKKYQRNFFHNHKTKRYNNCWLRT